MKSLVQFLLESKGADLKDRKWARFFGDDYGKDISLKKTQWRTKKFLKEYKDNISENAYDFLMKLAVLKQEEYDSRSSLQANFYKQQEYYFDFNISVSNISSAIENKLSTKVISKKFGLTLEKAIGLRDGGARNKKTEGYYSCDTSGFGTTAHLMINCYTESKEEFFNIFNYVADTLNEISNNILSYEDDYKDKDAIRQRQNRNKKEE